LVDPATTFAPACANPNAIARPMPQVPPVTNVTISDCDFGATVSTEQPYFLYNVRGLKLNRVKIGGKEYNTTLSA
jgi:hypothetical protein